MEEVGEDTEQTTFLTEVPTMFDNKSNSDNIKTPKIVLKEVKK